MYVSLSAEPGYDTDLLSKQFGFGGPLMLFSGNPKSHNSTMMQWGNDTHHIKGDVLYIFKTVEGTSINLRYLDPEPS